MAEVYHNNIIDIDLESGTLFRSFLNHTIGSGDNNANWYGVRVFRKGEPIALSGCSVQGLFMPASGAAILISDGTHTWVSGNEAAVLLPQACYNVKGQFTLTIKIIGTNSYSITDTVRIIDGVVADTYSENPVAPTAAVPTYQEILAVYDQMVAAKDGSVRFDIEQELTAAQMTQARGNIAAASESDVSDLNSALKYITGNEFLVGEYQNGYIALNHSTVDITNTHPTYTNVKYALIQCSPGDVFWIKGWRYNSTALIYAFIESDGTTRTNVVTYASSIEEYTRLVAPENAAYLVSNINPIYDFGLIKGDLLDLQLLGVQDYLKSYNLFCRKTSIGGYITNSGDISASTEKNEITSDYIPVDVGNIITVQTYVNQANALWQAVVYYDSNKNFISRNASDHADTTIAVDQISIPSGVAYIRVSTRIYAYGLVSVTKGSFIPAYSPCPDDISTKNDIKNTDDKVDGLSNNVVELTGNTIYLDFESGYIPVNRLTIDKNKVILDSIFVHIVLPCVEKDVFYIKGHGGSTGSAITIRGLWTFIDSNGAKLKYGTGAIDDYESIIAPANSAYLIVNVDTTFSYGLIKNMPIGKRIDSLEMELKGSTGLSNPLLRPAKPRCAMHRGYSTQAPENTIPAFTLAGQAGAWAIETDVYETTDGYFVLSHDNDVSRMTDGAGKITEMTYAQTQECTIDAGANIDLYQSLKMPTLTEYLSICHLYGCVAFVEIKGISNYDKLVEIVESSGMSGSVVYMMYYDSTKIENIRQYTTAPIILLASTNAAVESLLGVIKLYPDLWSGIYGPLVTPEMIQNFHKLNIPVTAWYASNATFFQNGGDVSINDGTPTYDPSGS